MNYANKILQGDSLQILKEIPSGICRCAVTSPPYFGLRDYCTSGQIGLEDTPEKYIQNLVAIFREARRVLSDDGTLWLNIGDSYAGSGKGRYSDGRHSEGAKQATNRGSTAGSLRKNKLPNYKDKDLIGIPWLLAFALRADGWYLRQDIVWEKPNAMPESVKDRCTKSHEYIFLLSKSRNYYFDFLSISEPTIRGYAGSSFSSGKTAAHQLYRVSKKPRTENGKRRRRSVWSVPTYPLKEAHFATFPPELIRPCILAGSQKGDIVLDPFFGSGTTGVVALQEERAFLGIELNPQYISISQNRIKNESVNFLQGNLFINNLFNNQTDFLINEEGESAHG